MKKRLLALILAFVCLVNAAPFSVFATEIEDSEPSSAVTLTVSDEEASEEPSESASEPTEINTEPAAESVEESAEPEVQNTVPDNSCGENLTWTLDDSGTLLISGTGKMTDYSTCQDTPWYEFQDSITKVVIENGAVSIGSNAFAQCKNLTSADIAASVIAIGENAFSACTSLETLSLSDSLLYIGNAAFSGCSELNSIYFQGDAPSIGSNSFANTSTTVYYPAGNTTWEKAIAQNFGGSITWIANCPGDHEFTEVVTSATCTTEGYTTYTCSKCGTTHQDNYTAAIGHDFANGICITCGTKFAAPVVSASNTSNGKIRLTWMAVDNASAYIVYASSDSGSTFNQIATTAKTTLTHNSAIRGTYYYYYVVAVTEDGSKSDVSNLIGCACLLAKPVVTVSNIESSGKIRITWTPVEGAVKYQLYRSTSKNGYYSLLMTTSGTVCNNTSAASGVTYYYKVKAIAKNSAADSHLSAVKGRTCDLPRPVISVSNNTSNGKVWITWKPVEGAVKYQVYCATSKEGPYNRILTTSGTRCKHNSGVAGVTYYYKVRAIAAEPSANSAHSSIKARTCDLAQPRINAISGPTGKPRVTWDAVEGAIAYKVYRASSIDGPYKLKYTTTGTSYTNSGAALGATYYYKVRAIASESSGNSAYSTADYAQSLANVYKYVYSSYSTTKYGTAARNTNLALSCKAINGTILAPGDEFSFNEIVGPRTEKKGYLIAGQTGGGEGRGGGICQVSTTLFNAALLGNLKITKRYQHSEAITYAPRGRDAMLYASKCDFRFRNNSDYYIMVKAKASNGTVSISFMTRESGVSPKADVDLVVTQVDDTYTLTRYYQGVPNYTAKSTY